MELPAGGAAPQRPRRYCWSRGRFGRRLFDICGDVGDVARLTQIMGIGEMLHERIPALIVTEIDELSGNHAKVLPGDCRDTSIRRPATISAMTRGTDHKYLLPVRGVRLA